MTKLVSLAAIVTILLVAILSGPVSTAGAQQEKSSLLDPSLPRTVVTTYCVTCHNERLKTGGLALDAVDVADVASRREIWEKVVKKVRAGLMPPAGSRRPDPAMYDKFASWLEAELDRAAAASPDPGRADPLHRLNRAEYQTAVRDVLGVDVDVTTLLPADDASYGFDNIAGVLRMSPTLMERYLAAAQQIAPLALASPDIQPGLKVFHVPDDLRQEDQLDGLPLGTRGGTRILETFPATGTYSIKARLQRNGSDYVPVFAETHELEVAVDGIRRQVFTLAGEPPPPSAPGPERRSSPSPAGGPTRAERAEERKKIDSNWQVRVPLTAGPHEVTVAFVKTVSSLDESPRRPFLKPYGIGQGPDSRTVPYLGDVEISGPYDPARDDDAPSRRLILVCQPASVADELPCARKIMSRLAERAYRRPVSDVDLEVLLEFFRDGRQGRSFEHGIEFAVERLLVAPQFLFRVEADRAAAGSTPAGASQGTAFRVSDRELASRLSFFLWSSVPDAELLDLAAKEKLNEPDVLERQVRRMLSDRRAEALVTNFAGQWLLLRNVDSVKPPGWLFPDFDEGLRRALRRETELFVGSIVREDRGLLELLTADYTFVNERLARHYGITGVRGPQFRRVTVDTTTRGGLLGQGSILAVTSYPNRTSPVKRGKWVLENLLGTPPPLPPPNVPSLKEEGEDIAHLSLRQRMEQHRASAACASCHRLMDPLGFALENFDAIGRFRERDEAFSPIDTAGVFPDGTKFAGLPGLRQVLLNHSEQVVDTIIEKLMTYALGRGVEYSDAPAIRQIRRQAAPERFRFSTVVLGIVKSVPFQMRKAQS